jgi:hypothetical protein
LRREYRPGRLRRRATERLNEQVRDRAGPGYRAGANVQAHFFFHARAASACDPALLSLDCEELPCR